MATIAQELTRIQTAKSDIKTSIEAKGVQVPSNALISDYNTYINQITGSGGVTLPNIDNANSLFFTGRFIEIETDLYAKFTGYDCRLLASSITDANKKIPLATLYKWVKKAFDNTNDPLITYNPQFIGLVNASTVYAGDTIEFDYSNYVCNKNFEITLAAFSTMSSPNNLAKLVFNFDTSNQTGVHDNIFLSGAYLIGSTVCPHIEVYGLLTDAQTSFAISNVGGSAIPHFYDKIVLKNLNTNIDKEVTLTSMKASATTLTTWENSLQYYSNNVGKVTFKLPSTRYNQIANTQLETDYNNYNVYFSI